MTRDPHNATIASPGEKGAFLRWFTLLGGAVAWSLHIGLSWVIGEFGCVRQLHHIMLANLTLTAWLLIGLTVLMLLPTLAAAWIGRPERWRRAVAQLDRADATDAAAADPRGEASDYLLRMGFVLNALFAIVILAQAIPIVFYLQRC